MDGTGRLLPASPVAAGGRSPQRRSALPPARCEPRFGAAPARASPVAAASARSFRETKSKRTGAPGGRRTARGRAAPGALTSPSPLGAVAPRSPPVRSPPPRRGSRPLPGWGQRRWPQPVRGSRCPRGCEHPVPLGTDALPEEGGVPGQAGDGVCSSNICFYTISSPGTAGTGQGCPGGSTGRGGGPETEGSGGGWCVWPPVREHRAMSPGRCATLHAHRDTRAHRYAHAGPRAHRYAPPRRPRLCPAPPSPSVSHWPAGSERGANGIAAGAGRGLAAGPRPPPA